MGKTVVEGVISGCKFANRRVEEVQKDSLPTSYIGLTLGAYHNLVAVQDGGEEIFKKKLAIWTSDIYMKEED